MTSKQDIIGIAEDIIRRDEFNQKKYGVTPGNAVFLAQALLDRDEKLKIATEALEKLSRLGNEPHPGNSKGNVIAQRALASIHSLPTQ